MIEKYQFLQNNNDENYLSIPLNLEYDFTRDAGTIENFINNQVQNTLVTPIESNEITIFTPVIDYNYIFYFSGSTTLSYSNLFNINGLFDPINPAFKNSLYIFQFYDSTNKDKYTRLFTEYYHLKQTDITSQHNNISKYLRLGIPRKYNLTEVYLKIQFFNAKDGNLINFKNFDLYNTTSEDALFFKISLNHTDLTYSFEQKNLQFIQMINNQVYNEKINNMYPSLTASTLTLPAGDFISADGEYYSTDNPFDPKLINVDNGFNSNTPSFENIFLFKWEYTLYDPLYGGTPLSFNGVPYNFTFDKQSVLIKVKIQRIESLPDVNPLIKKDTNYYQKFLNSIDILNPDSNPDIIFSFSNSYNNVKKPPKTKLYTGVNITLFLPNRNGNKSYTHNTTDEAPSQSSSIFLEQNDDSSISYINNFPLDPNPINDYYEFCYILYNLPRSTDITQNAHGILSLITSITDDQLNILDYTDSSGITHNNIAYLVDKKYFQDYNKILYTDSSTYIANPDFQFTVEGI